MFRKILYKLIWQDDHEPLLSVPKTNYEAIAQSSNATTSPISDDHQSITPLTSISVEPSLEYEDKDKVGAESSSVTTIPISDTRENILSELSDEVLMYMSQFLDLVSVANFAATSKSINAFMKDPKGPKYLNGELSLEKNSLGMSYHEITTFISQYEPARAELARIRKEYGDADEKYHSSYRAMDTNQRWLIATFGIASALAGTVCLGAGILLREKVIG